jgi:dipeptidyl aminopeptidase/acylaminoacyl peptidase
VSIEEHVMMRLRAWVLALVVLLAFVAVVPRQAQALPSTIQVVDRNEDPPPDLLDEEELERIARLQNDGVYTLPLSPVRPDDTLVFVTSGEQIGFLNLIDGSSAAINPESFGPFVPLPLLGVTRFAWLDPTGLGSLAINQLAVSPENAFVRLRIDSESLELSAEPLRLPPRTGIVSIAPDLRHILLASLPEQGEQGTAAPVRVQINRPAPGPARMATLALPPALRRQVAEVRRLQPAALARVWQIMQDSSDGAVSAAPQTVDLLLASDDQVRYVTTVPAASVGFGETWSRDSSKLAISFYGLADAEATRPRFDGARLSDEVYRDVTGNLRPSENPILQNNNTYVVDATSGAVEVLRPSAADAPPLLAAHAWAPDNRTLLVKAWHPAVLKGRTHPIYSPQFSERVSFRFYELDPANGLRETGSFESDLFSSGAFSSVVADFVSPDELIFRAARGVDRHPYYYNRVSGELRNLADRSGAYYNVFSTNQSRQIVFTFTSFTAPPDVYRMGWDGRNLVRLTWAGEELRELANLRQDSVRFKLPNGQTRVGVLIQPADRPFPPQNTPIVVWQQGGPGAPMTNQWLANVEDPYALLPGMGIALLVTPLAGRPGYSPAVFNSLADGANFGRIDIDEQAAIVRQMIRRGWTSQGKVGITGCSYGGYFTTQSIVRHPDLYTAANPQCGLVDVTTEWTRGFDALMPYLMGLPPFEIPREYQRDSPIYNTGRVKAAVLTFHGTEDYLPLVQNENLHLQLVNRGLPARMVKFVGEGHGLINEENQLYAAQEQVNWFRTHLK